MDRSISDPKPIPTERASLSVGLDLVLRSPLNSRARRSRTPVLRRAFSFNPSIPFRDAKTRDTIQSGGSSTRIAVADEEYWMIRITHICARLALAFSALLIPMALVCPPAFADGTPV